MDLPQIKLQLPKRPITIDQDLLNKALKYVDSYWKKLERHHNEDSGTLVGLPYPYVVPAADPNAQFRFEEQYYWDSYFTALGMTGAKHQILVEGMLENLLFLFRRFGMIPNASRMYFTSRSQPPILTSFIFHVYETFTKDSEWLRQKIDVAKDEYEKVWMSKGHPQWHNVHRGLSRYYDINMLHDLAEAESGWDMTPRFERKCLDFLPVDLNALLYKYETDFARAAEILGDTAQSADWSRKARSRMNAMDDLMWGKLRGFYFDYNYQRGVLGDIWSLAGFYPMWAGMVTPEQAKKMVFNLDKFERRGGLTATTRPLIDYSVLFGSLKAQWAYPNGWAPLHYIVIEGLKRYGYHEHAKRIATEWVATNLKWFDKNGVFLEKYNVVNNKKSPVEGLYPSQTGFGWSNAILVNFVKEFNLKEGLSD
ncbi:alpha,alpha-trehalase [Candidatus Saccharibacteria bacterium]|nr:alpha,alpha-trehalase [Candidatus Saccharibacteria bacterium]